MTKRVLLVIALLLLIFAFPRPVEAKRVLPRWSSQTSTGMPSTSGRPIVSVKFIPSRLGITITVSNSASASAINYSLSYLSRDIEQGADGALKLDQRTVVKQLIFGSCSTNNACRYDSDITDAKLTVTKTLKSGTKIVKSFKLKV